MATPDVTAALEKLGLPTTGKVRMWRATDAAEAEQIQTTGRLLGRENNQAWVATHQEIGTLHSHAGIGDRDHIDTLVELEVDVNDLYFEVCREGEDGPIGLFYLLPPADGTQVDEVAVTAIP